MMDIESFLKYVKIKNYFETILVKNSFYLALSRLLVNASGFIFWIVAAKYYSLDELGIGTALISYLGLVSLFSGFGFSASIIRFFPSGDKTKILSSCIITIIISSVFVGSFFIFIADDVSKSLSFLQNYIYAIAFILISILNSISQIVGIVLIANRMTGSFFVQNLISALRIFFVIPFVSFGPFGIICAICLSLLISTLYVRILFKKNNIELKLELDMDFIWKSFDFSFWSYITNILSILPALILPIMILNLLGESEAAKYYIAYSIGTIFMIIPQSLSTSLFIEGSHGINMRIGAIYSAIISAILLFCSLLFIMLFGKQILGLINSKYIDAFWLMIIISFLSLPATIYYIFETIQRVSMRVRNLAILNALGCVFQLLFSYLFIQYYGLNGAGYGLVFAYGILDLAIICIIKIEGWV